MRRKRYSASALEFTAELEENLLRLRDELRSGSYRPGPYRTFMIREPKPRLISAAPFRDRVVHHALCNNIEPLFDRTFIFDSYATRTGKGTHRAVERFHGFLRSSAYVLKCDIEKYFPSIDHEILKRLIRRKLKCAETLRLIDRIIDCSCLQEDRSLYFPGDDLFEPFTRRRGLPIGNLTSQFFANIYLDPLDHLVKERLGFGKYLRYMDDFCLFADDKLRLRQAYQRIERFLLDLRLILKSGKSRIYRTDEGVGFLRFRIFPTHRRINTRSAWRAERRLARLYRRLRARSLQPADFRRSLMSWIGHAAWGDTRGLVRAMMRRVQEAAVPREQTSERRHRSEGHNALCLSSMQNGTSI